jgi:excisionase family DNA binding protein
MEKLLTFEKLPEAVAMLIQEVSELKRLLIEKQKNNENTLTDDKWFNITELCDYLPDKPTKNTVYGWVHFKKIPYRKRGKALLFKKSEIDAWLENSSKNSTFEPTNVLKQKK